MNSEHFYDQWLDLLRKDTPSLENPEEMTASIMGKIGNMPVHASPKKITYWITFLSNAAACWLFCLLIYELNRPLINNIPDRSIVSTVTKSPLPKTREEIPGFLMKKERKAAAYRELQMKLAENYIKNRSYETGMIKNHPNE
jgi:hypothetical protein